MDFCKKCGDWLRAEKCTCKAFIVITEDGEEHEIYGISEYAAALNYAKKSNVEGDYYLMNESVVITVNGKSFSISATPDIHYSATQIN